MLAFKRKLKRRNPASVCPSWVFVCGRNGSQQARTNAEKRSEAPQSAREAAKPNDICCLTASGGRRWGMSENPAAPGVWLFLHRCR